MDPNALVILLPIAIPLLFTAWAVVHLQEEDAGAHRWPSTTPRRAAVRWVLVALDSALAVSAFAGSWYGIAGAPDIPTEWLAGTPFDTYLVPSLVLGYVVGNAQMFAAIFVARRLRHDRAAALAAAGVLAVWICVQVAVIGWVSWLQPAMLIAAAACAVLAAALPARLPRTG